MNRREFMCLAVGLVAGSMLTPPPPIVRLPIRPRIGPLPTPTPSMPTKWAYEQEQAKMLDYLDSLSCPPLRVTLVYRDFQKEIEIW